MAGSQPLTLIPSVSQSPGESVKSFKNASSRARLPPMMLVWGGRLGLCSQCPSGEPD